MEKYLVVSVLGADKPGIANALTTISSENSCNVVDSRMAVLGGEFAVIMMISGSWSSIAKFENSLKSIAKKLDLITMVKPTEMPTYRSNLMPYGIQVVALDSPGIIKEISTFFASQDINIENLQTDAYKAPHTAAPMLVLNMTVNIPVNMHIADLREKFTLFCDDLNLDASMEPMKGHL
ncbi:MAG: glycine cleavage system protein R [Gammaproteobacteria bacterium]|nr:MAG: glycine cleavage system protein R [Gammaproteobacteria bacterium]